MKKVIIESPYGGTREINERNLTYVRRCMADCFFRGESPYASHALYTQPGVLDDNNPDEREKWIRAGFLWRQFAEKTIVYTDYGISSGMRLGIRDSEELNIPVEYREIGRNDAKR